MNKVKKIGDYIYMFVMLRIKKGSGFMYGDFDSPIIKNFKDLYDNGYRCILYEVDEKDNLFTVHLKNFQSEDTTVFKCNPDEGVILQNYIDRLS